MPYIGRTLGQGTRSRFLYTATAGQTTFSGSDTQSNTLAYADNNGLDCFQNGVLLKGGGADYTATTGTSVVLTTGASVNDVIEILVYDVFAIADHVKKSGDAMTGALTNIDVNGTELILDADGDTSIEASTDDTIVIDTGGSERARIDGSGNFFVSATATSGFQSSSSESGTILYGAGGIASNSASNDVAAVFNRLGNHGNIVLCKKDGTSVGAIATDSSVFKFYGVFSNGAGLGIYSNRSVRPLDSSGDASDNDCDLGHSSQRYATLFAGTGSINTSDKNEKQDVEVFSDAEMKVAKKISSLFKKFKYKDAVIAKGDDARVHSGVIAQEIESAFKEEKLDASNYAFWCKDTWKSDDGKEQTRYGIRYSELLSFICAYNEQRFASIEARLTALEGN